MLPQNGGRPPPHNAGDDLPDELPAKALDYEFNTKHHARERPVVERPT
jgi:hypothetical protein